MSKQADTSETLWAGAATADITPPGAVFLYGYPHVHRTSTGVHDPLECAALYLRSGPDSALFLAHDLIWIPRALAAQVRRRIAASTGVPEAAIMLTATHTHSGPVVANCLSNAADSAVPPPDAAYLAVLADQIVWAAEAAARAARPAEVGVGIAHAAGVGSNRHNPAGPADPAVPVLLARSLADGTPIGCMLVYGMHPTVLHEDSTLISADFPYFTRRFLQRGGLPPSCPVLFHQGASGNQSPRHVTRANTFSEAERIGENLGHAIAATLPGMSFQRAVRIGYRRISLDLEPRKFPAAAEAMAAEQEARARFARLQSEKAPRPEVRTAECDVFGAEETAELARAAVDGRLDAAIRACLPAEIQLIEIGPWKFVGWPGEFFVEYALAVKVRSPDTFVITLANGELQGYIVTDEAAARRFYEANNAVFSPANGARFVEATLGLLAK